MLTAEAVHDESAVSGLVSPASNHMCILQIFSYSSFNKAEGAVGECTAAALEAKGAEWVKVKAPKVKAPSKQYGVPAQPGPDLGIEYRYQQLWDLWSYCRAEHAEAHE